jgi:hypothetical protein
MENQKGFVIVTVALLFIVGIFAYEYYSVGKNNTENKNVTQSTSKVPHYFLVIHNEPYSGDPKQQQLIEGDYKSLENLVSKADSWHMKLTLMFSTPWIEYILKDPARTAEVKGWQKEGHEIAVHHHGLGHFSWDGYSNYPMSFIKETRNKLLQTGQTAGNVKMDPSVIYQGNLNDFSNVFANSGYGNIISGCVNDENDKNEMPDSIIYDTCAGFYNFGDTITKATDEDRLKGVNDYILSGTVNGIQRKWLSHYAIYKDAQAGINAYKNLNSSEIYGAVTHSLKTDADSMIKLMEFLHSEDPQGLVSETVSSVIENKLLPEKNVPNSLIISGSTANIKNPCGDGVCDDYEKTHPGLCSQDCK